jgi:hypothetical protein
MGELPMKIFKIMVQRADDGALFMGDAIKYEDKLWLVPEWSVFPSERIQKPVRIISLDGLPVRSAPPQYPADLFLQQPMTKAVLEGQQTKGGPVVIEGPDLSVPLPPEAMN